LECANRVGASCVFGFYEAGVKTTPAGSNTVTALQKNGHGCRLGRCMECANRVGASCVFRLDEAGNNTVTYELIVFVLLRWWCGVDSRHENRRWEAAPTKAAPTKAAPTKAAPTKAAPAKQAPAKQPPAKNYFTIPENPVNAMARMPAVIRPMAAPRMGRGISVTSNRSRMPAKMINATPKPTALANEKMMDCSKL